MTERAQSQTSDLLARLVGFASVVGRPNGEIIAFVRSYLARHGVEAQVLPGPEGDRANLFATIGPGERAGYVLSGHLDVVPAVDQPGWLADPFVLRREGDRLIGRGAVDMKGFVAAVLAAVPALVQMPLAAPIHIALSYDEEAGCRGVPHLIAALPGLCAAPQGAVIGEPTGLVPVLRHKGKATLRVSATGRAAHSARPDQGQNAIHDLLPCLAAARDLSARLAHGPRHSAFQPPHSTAQIGTITGGTAVNMVPDRAEALIELRAIPGEDPEALLAPVIAAAPEAGIVARYPGLDLSGEAPLARLLSELSGRTPCPAVSFGTEAGLFAEAGIPAIVCGPGDIARAHRPEEFITTDELTRAGDLIMALARRLL